MIYECPNCRTPQDAGQTVCPNCHAEFDGPVPSDAVVPPPAEVEVLSEADSGSIDEAGLEADAEVGAAPINEVVAEPVSAAEIEAMRPQAEAVTQAEAPSEAPLTEMPTPASSSQPYLTAPSFSPPVYSAPDTDTTPSSPPFSRLSRALLVAFPIILVLVLGSVFYANSLNAGSDTVPAPPSPPTVQASVPLPPPSPAAPDTTPTVLQGAGNADSGADDLRAKILVGHWIAASGDFYVFSSDGSGSRGNPVKQQKEQTFLWGLVQNRLMLYRDQNEMLRFNAGPDDNTIFLAAQTGHYVQFSRSKT